MLLIDESEWLVSLVGLWALIIEEIVWGKEIMGTVCNSIIFDKLKLSNKLY